MALRPITKYILTAALLGLTLSLIVLIYLAITFDPNEHKDKIIRIIKQETGRTLTIEGNLELSLFPWLGISVHGISLDNPEAMAAGKLITLGQAELHLKLVPLLSQNVEVDTITLTGLQLNLTTDRKGQQNWSFAQDSNADTAAAAGPSDSTARSAKTISNKLDQLRINGLNIENATINWTDENSQDHYSLKDLSLKSDAIKLGQPFSLTLAFVIDGLSSQAIPVTLSSDFTVSPSLEQIEISRLTIKPGELIIDSTMQINLEQTSPTITGTVNIPTFTPRTLLKQLDSDITETSDPTVLRQASGQFNFQVGPDQASLNKLSLHIDDTRIQGQANIKLSDNNTTQFKLNIDKLNIDRYLPASHAAPAVAPAAASTAAVIALPAESLRQLDITGQAGIGTLQVSNLKLANVTATVNAQQGLIKLHPVKAELYQGLYKGNLQLDVRQATPQFSMQESLTDIAAEPFLIDLLQTDLVSGQADLNLKLTTAGTTIDSLRKNLNGSAAFAFQDGAVKGFNVADMIRQAKAKLDKQPPPAANTLQTDFSAMTATVTITNGIADNNDLDVRAPYLRLSGTGTANLVTEQIDYRLQARVIESATGQDGVDLAKLKGFDIPIIIRGPFTAPDIKLDSAVIRNKIQQQAEKQIKQKTQLMEDELKRRAQQQEAELKQRAQQKEDELKKRAEEKLRQKLKSLF